MADEKANAPPGALELQRAIEENFPAFCEAAPDAMIIVGPDGRILFANGQVERLFGYTRAELLGQSVEVLVPAGVRARHAAHRAKFASEPRLRPMGAGLDLRAVRKDGTEFPAEISLGPVRTSAGVLVTAAIRDVTQRKRAEEAMARARDKAEALNRELEAFSYSVAHDLRAPLRGIAGFAEAIIDDQADNLEPDSKRYLERIRALAQHMGQLIESLLSLARITRTELKRQEVDLSRLARVAAERLTLAQPDRPIEFSIQMGVVTEGDAALLAVLLDNLMANAWKFTRDQPHARVEFGKLEQDGAQVYFVRDNGAGFDMASSRRLFGVFQRLHAATEFEGTGVGLATAQRVVQRHDGRIWAEGRVGQGATFYFTLNEPTTTSRQSAPPKPGGEPAAYH